MKDYEYQELIENTKETFDDFRIDAAEIGEQTVHVLERFFDSYGCIIEVGECEAAIISSTICIKLSEIHETIIHKDHYKKLMGILEGYDSSKIVGEISEDEVYLLNEQVAKATKILQGLKIWGSS